MANNKDIALASKIPVAGKAIYFIGIAGTGMSAVAGYCHALGCRVSGSDEGIYPPVSTILEQLSIPVHVGYNEKNIASVNPDLVVVGNRIGADNPEYIFAENNLAVTHFPALLGAKVAAEGKKSIVVAGTHGKTTTSALLSYVLTQMGDDPSYIIGGMPTVSGFCSFRSGKGDYFCFEGDEYDCSLFDKQAKFLHYRPSYLLLNVIEWDHADIYPDLQAVLANFRLLLASLHAPALVVANIDCPNVVSLLAESEIKTITVSPYKRNEHADIVVLDYPPRASSVRLRCRSVGDISVKTTLLGDYNAANIAMVAGALQALAKDVKHYLGAVESFTGVAKRLEHKFSEGGVDCYVDFAHHPTAVRKVLRSLAEIHPDRRIVAVFELKSASSVRSVFFEQYAESFVDAGVVILWKRPLSGSKLKKNERMDIQALAKKIGDNAHSFTDYTEMGRRVLEELRTGDVLILMSCADYDAFTQAACRWLSSGIHRQYNV